LFGHIPDLPNAPRAARILVAIGPLARCVDDLGLALRVIAGPDGHDTDVPPGVLIPEDPPPFRGLRIAWAPTFPGVHVAEDVQRAIGSLATELGRLGGCVEERLPEVDFARQQAVDAALVDDYVGRLVWPQPEGGGPISLAGYFKALDERDTFIPAWERFFDDCDVLCPAAMTTAFKHGPTGAPLLVDGEQVPYWETIKHCCPLNLTGHPAIVLPLAQDRNGPPIGVQLVGRRWAEERLLAIAKTVSQATEGFQRPPGY